METDTIEADRPEPLPNASAIPQESLAKDREAYFAKVRGTAFGRFLRNKITKGSAIATGLVATVAGTFYAHNGDWPPIYVNKVGNSGGIAAGIVVQIDKDATFNGIVLSPFSRVDGTLNGANINLIDYSSGTINGLELGLIDGFRNKEPNPESEVDYRTKKLNGLDIGLVNTADESNGVRLGLGNFVNRGIGLDLGVLTNVSKQYFIGSRGAIIFNSDQGSGYSEGLDLGVFNLIKREDGANLGLIAVFKKAGDKK